LACTVPVESCAAAAPEVSSASPTGSVLMPARFAASGSIEIVASAVGVVDAGCAESILRGAGTGRPAPEPVRNNNQRTIATAAIADMPTRATMAVRFLFAVAFLLGVAEGSLPCTGSV